MKQLTLFIFALFLFPCSGLWAQDTDGITTPGDSLMVNAADYGLHYEAPDTSRNLWQMPIHNPRKYEDKEFIWSPSHKWIYDMPILGPTRQDSSHQKKDK